MPTNILNLHSYTIINFLENDHDYHIDAEAKDHPKSCQLCDSQEIVGFGRNKQLIQGC
jgi:hypothetical protein